MTNEGSERLAERLNAQLEAAQDYAAEYLEKPLRDFRVNLSAHPYVRGLDEKGLPSEKDVNEPRYDQKAIRKLISDASRGRAVDRPTGGGVCVKDSAKRRRNGSSSRTGKRNSPSVYDEVFKTAYNLEVLCDEKGVPRKKVRPLFDHVFNLIRGRYHIGRILRLMSKIVETFSRHLD